MGTEWRNRWTGLPLWARCALVVYAAGFTEGSVTHIRQLTQGGWHTYGYAPVVLQAFFVSLVLLDPLVIALTGLARRAGVWLAAVVMVADMSANWYANRANPSPSRPASGLLFLTIFGAFVLITAIPLQRRLVTRGG